MNPKIAICTLGCRANQYDSDRLEEQLRSQGFEIVPFQEKADGYIVNSCTVTRDADQAARRLLRQAHRSNPGALIVVTGCYAQVAPQELAKMEGITHIVGNDKKEKIVDLITMSLQGQRPALSIATTPRRSRAYVKIQDGCNFRCSFCIIPFARGKSRSRSIENIVAEIRLLASKGYHEVVLTGIHIGSFGWDLAPRQSLLDLMVALEATKPIERIRLSTLDPDEVGLEMIDLMADSGIFCPHLHLAVQSGSDRILGRMRRRHCEKELVSVTRHANLKIKDLNLGADVITGFPSETREEHDSTKKLLEDLPISYFHVFPYSERRGTSAAAFDGSIPVSIRHERTAELIALSSDKKRMFWESQLNREKTVIAEESGSPDFQKAMTDNFIPVWLEQAAVARGSLNRVCLKQIREERVWGEWLFPAMRKSA